MLLPPNSVCALVESKLAKVLARSARGSSCLDIVPSFGGFATEEAPGGRVSLLENAHLDQV